jgi:hypothetical protein
MSVIGISGHMADGGSGKLATLALALVSCFLIRECSQLPILKTVVHIAG